MTKKHIKQSLIFAIGHPTFVIRKTVAGLAQVASCGTAKTLGGAVRREGSRPPVSRTCRTSAGVRGLEAMPDLPNRRPRLPLAVRLGMVGLLAVLALPASARAGKLSWLDELVQGIVLEAKAGGWAAVRGGDELGVAARGAGRLFIHEAEDGLEIATKRSEDLARIGRRVEQPSEALLQARFSRLLRHDPEAVRTFATLAPAEKRLVVEMGETAQRLARRYPERAESMIRALGTEGLSAVRVFGDDVAETLVKEGPQGLGVLRKTGRGGWAFFTQQVLPHKKKLLAAGVLAAFLANPEKFVDDAGRVTEYAVREFARAGVQLAGAVGGGAAKGLGTAVAATLARHGLDFAALRYLGMAAAGLVVVLATMVLLGLPIGWFFRPFGWCGPTTHREAFSDNASRSFSLSQPTTH